MVNLTVEGMARYKEERTEELKNVIIEKRKIETADVDELMEAIIRAKDFSAIERYGHILPKYTQLFLEEKMRVGKV